MVKFQDLDWLRSQIARLRHVAKGFARGPTGLS
jgi:hypothetical protein